MRQFIAASIALSTLCGCGWFSGPDTERIYQPDDEFGTSQPKSATPVQPKPVAPRTLPVAPATKEEEPQRAVLQTTTRPAPLSRVPTSQPASQPISAAMLRIDRTFVSVDDILRPIERKLQAMAAKSTPEAFGKAAGKLINVEIDNRIEHVLLLAQAGGHLREAELAGIDRMVVDVLRQAIAEEGSKERLIERLRAEGADLDTWKRDTRHTLMIQAYLHRRLDQRIVLTRRMMWRHYQGNLDKYKRPKKVGMQLITIPVNHFLPRTRPADDAHLQAAREKAQAEISKAAAALKAGQDFAEIAKTHSKGIRASEGGMWEMMVAGSFRPKAVEDVAFAQGLGQVSDVIETPEGFYIVKTHEIQAGPVPFDQAQVQIGRDLRLKEYHRLAKEYYEQIRGRAAVTGLERFRREAVEQAVRTHFRR